MSLRPLITVSLCSLLAACTSNPAPSQEKPVEAAVTLCYAFEPDTEDIITMELTIADGEVTGDLNYQLSGKDRNTGVIEGEMRGDTLFADYTFQSEGLESVREVVFLRQGDSLFEGHGPVTEKAGKVIFKNPAALTFHNGIRLVRRTCN